MLEALNDVDVRTKHLEASLDHAQKRLVQVEARLAKMEAGLAALENETARLAAMQPPMPAAETRKLLARIRRLQREAAQPDVSPRDLDARASHEANFREVHRAFKQGEFARAARICRALLQEKLPPAERGRAWYWLGEALFALGRNKEALVAFRQAAMRVRQHPKRPDAMLKYATLLREVGKITEARAVLQSLAAGFPNTSAARRARQILEEDASSSGQTWAGKTRR